MCTRITQAMYHSNHTYIPETLEELKKCEREMKKNEINHRSSKG